MGACLIGMAKPGDLDPNFDPELRAWVTPDHVTIAPDGRTWIGGGFDRGDDYSTGDLVRLGENGRVESEPAAGYLNRPTPFIMINGSAVAQYGSRLADPFLLENGDFLLRGESGGWLRISATGDVIGKAFLDRQTGEAITPQFEQAGKLWVIRQLVNGERVLERRSSANGTVDAIFPRSTLLPRNVNAAVPGLNGSAWVLAGDAISGFSSYGYGAAIPKQQVFQVDADGIVVGQPRVIAVPRRLGLVAGPQGKFRLTYGPDQSRWGYWPAPSSTSYKIEWYSATGALERSQDFYLGLYETFAWAESADGSFVAMESRVRVPGSTLFYIGKTATLRRYGPDGAEDPTFVSPGQVRSVKAMAGGKWLIDGLRRLHADGREDSFWKAPDLSRPAVVQTLLPLPAGKVLAGGNFATVDGSVKNRLVVFRANGQVDQSFIPDERIEEWRSVAVAGNAIYVVTPGPIDFADGFQSNLVKLRLDGTLDENYRPVLAAVRSIGQIPQAVIVPFIGPIPKAVLYQSSTWATRVTGMAGGDLLVETYRDAGDVFQLGLIRLRENGSAVPGFQQAPNTSVSGGTLALKNGGFISGGVFFRANGSVERDLTRPDSSLVPLCECPAGVLFRTGDAYAERNLALWTRKGFARWFRPPALDWSKPMTATAGELGTIYLAATLPNGVPSIHRLLPTGQIDRTFRGPVFESRERQFGQNWWKAEESGKVAFDPALPANRIPLYSQSILWNPSTHSLWTGGDFNMVNGQPRDGLAQISGGFSWRPWR